MLDAEMRALRRFCYTVSAVLLAICAAALWGLLFMHDLSTGAVAVAILLTICSAFLQYKVTDRLAAYLDMSIRYYLKRFSLCSIISFLRCSCTLPEN